MSLKRKTVVEGLYDEVRVNVYEINTKKIVFTGGQRDAANFIGITLQNLRSAMVTKYKVKKKYAVRLASNIKT